MSEGIADLKTCTCFFCHNKMAGTERRVEWRGNDANGEVIMITPHSRCAREIAQHFIKDSWIAEGLWVKKQEDAHRNLYQ
jgi:hypothetical protein